MNIWAVSKAFFKDRLPNRYKYYISLKNECISDKGYLHALSVWNNVWDEKNGWLSCFTREILLLADL